MQKLIIRNGLVITPFDLRRDISVLVKDGLIDSLAADGDIHESDCQVIDAGGCYVCPGFVDIHTHGGGGSDFMDATADDLAVAMAYHSSQGTTALLASTVAAPVGQMTAMLDLIRRYRSQIVAGCRLLGAHLEGPFLSEKNRGAHLPQFLLVPASAGWQFVRDYADVIVNLTVAPELPGSISLIRDLAERGIIISGGHDDALDSEIRQATDAGMSNVTHVFCANSTIAFRHGRRQVGLACRSLIDDRLTVEMIADNHHLPPDLVRLIYQCKGAGRACVVSDCLRAGGMPADGQEYVLGPRSAAKAQHAVVADGVASLPDGSRYAGSITPLSGMVRNMVRDCGIPLIDAVRMASATPAAIIRQNDIGSIVPGKKADFCLLDNNLNVAKTIVGGQIVYDRESIPAGLS